MALMATFDCFTPKHHVFWHVLANADFLGNPCAYACWEDESWNKALKQTCSFVSQLGFEGNVLLRMGEMLLRKGVKRSLADA